MLRRAAFTGPPARMLGGLLLLLAGCAQTTHEQDRRQATQRWEEVRGRVKLQLARQQLDNGQIDPAATALQEALALDPDNAEVHVLLARCSLERGQLAAATRAVERACTLDARHAEARYLRGLIEERRGNLTEALRDYTQAAAWDDANLDYLVSQAECLVALQRADEALELVRVRLNDFGNEPTLLGLQGEIALQLGDDRLALQSFRAVLAAGRGGRVVAEQYALLIAAGGDYVEALRVLEPLLRLGSEEISTSALHCAVECMLALERDESARQTIRQLLDREPQDRSAWYALARVALRNGDSGTLRRCLQQIHRLAPDDPTGLLLEAYTDVQAKDWSAARAALAAILVRDSDDPLIHCLMGDVARNMADASRAADHYRRALQIDPRCTWARTALTTLHAGLHADPQVDSGTGGPQPGPAAEPVCSGHESSGT